MYVSDRAGGILAAFDMMHQRPHHFFCLWHLMKNLRDMYPAKNYSDAHRNTMCIRLSELAYAPNVRCFNDALTEFYALGGDIAREFLKDLPLDRWTVAYAPNLLRYGELTSNAAESFNAWILDARSLPITYIVDMIRTQLMKWFVERRRESNKWNGALTERMEAKWNLDRSAASTWKILTCIEGVEFEVLSEPSTTVSTYFPPQICVLLHI